MAENWKQVEDLPYFVSDLGRVKSVQRGVKYLKPQNRGHGKVGVLIFIGGKKKMVHLDWLVANAFVPPVEGCNEVEHINGNDTDCTAKNLKWVESIVTNYNPLRQNSKRDKIYGAFDENNKMVWKGTSGEFSEHFGVHEKAIYSYANRGIKVRGLYEIRVIGTLEKQLKPKPKENHFKGLLRSVKPKNEELYRQIKKDLLNYGNTICEKKKTKEIVSMLESEGIRVTYRDSICCNDVGVKSDTLYLI